MPSPLVINPLSFEELSRVPLAEAQAKAEGVAAINRVNTDFNVDTKDLNYVNNLTKNITDSKDRIVSSISSNGIDSQTVSDVINLKKQRDNVYKTQIAKSEENKKIIDVWRQSVDEMVLKGNIPSKYGEKIKQKEYSKWQGTFNDKGTPNTFINTYGERYYDEDEDIKNVFKQAEDMTQLPGKEGYKYSSGSVPKLVNIPGIGNMIRTISPSEWQKMSNAQKIHSAKQLLWEQYTNPNTERGKYAKYADYGQEEFQALADKLNYYEQMYTKEKEDRQGGEAHYSEGSNPSQTTYVAQALRPSQYQESPNLDKASPGFFGKLAKSFVLTSDSSIDYLTGNNKNNPNHPSFWGHLNPFRSVTEFINNMKDDNKVLDTKSKVINQFDNTVQQLVKDKVITSKEAWLAQQNVKGVSEPYIKKVYAAVDKYQDEMTHVIEAPNIVSEDYMYTKFGLKQKDVDPVDAAKDLFKESTNYYNQKDRSILGGTSSEHEDLMKNLANKGAEVQGVIPMLSPDLLDEHSNYIDGLSSAKTVTITNKDSKNFGKKYYVKLPQSTRDKDPNYHRIEELNKRILSLPTSEKTSLGDISILINGNPVPIQVKHNDAKPGSYTFKMKGDPKTYDVTDDALTLMYGKEWLDTYNKKK